jgi:uncharacterized Zn-finger protein
LTATVKVIFHQNKLNSVQCPYCTSKVFKDPQVWASHIIGHIESDLGRGTRNIEFSDPYYFGSEEGYEDKHPEVFNNSWRCYFDMNTYATKAGLLAHIYSRHTMPPS